MATSCTQMLRTPLSLGHQRHFWGSRSWRDPSRPSYDTSKVFVERVEALHPADPRDRNLLYRRTCLRKGGHLTSKCQQMQRRVCYGHSKSPRASQFCEVDALNTKKTPPTHEKAPVWQSLLSMTAGLAFCYSLQAGQAQALEVGSGVGSADNPLVETRVDQAATKAPRILGESTLSSPPLTTAQWTGSPVLDPEGSTLSNLSVSTGLSNSPVLEASVEGKKGDSEAAPSERKRRTSNGIAAAAAAVAGVSLVASGGSSAAVAGTAAAAGAVTSAGGLAAASTLPISHAVATAAGLHVAEAVGATAIGAAAVTSAALAGPASGATAVAAGTTAAVAGASSALAATTTAVAGASAPLAATASAAVSATSAALSAAVPSSGALLALSIPAAVTSATSAAVSTVAIPSSGALLATSIPAAVASKAAVATSAGVASGSLASALPAIAAKSGATSAGAAISSAVASSSLASAVPAVAVKSGGISAGAALSSAGNLCTAPARAAAHAASSALVEGGAAAVAAAEAHSAAVLTQSGLASALASSAHHFVEGGVAGAIGATAVCPIDVVKTRMQGQETKKGEKPKYANPADCLVQILKDEGPGALFLGLIPQLLGVAPEKAMKLTVNDLLMSVLEGYIPGARLWTLELFAGSGGGLAQVVFTNPMEMVKIRQQMQGPAEDGHQKKSALQIAKELGPAGLYQGSVATLLREIPSSAIFFGCYIVLKDSFPDQPFVAGCLAAAPAAFLCTPMDVVKTRMQMERKEGEETLGFWDMMKKIARDEGPKALFNGGLTRVLRVSPQFGITLAVYELLNHW